MAVSSVSSRRRRPNGPVGFAVYDPLYGAIEVPTWLRPVVLSTEMQRLRDIRLINTSSPYFAGLSDTRRFTHSVGVLHLGLAAMPRLRQSFSDRELRALLVACLVHDVGTPPFAHVFEYLLKVNFGWTHEAMLRRILTGQFDRNPFYEQIYYDASRTLYRALAKIGVDGCEVADLVEGRGVLSKFIAGVLDLDNLDNVYRMSVMLGQSDRPAEAVQLASSIDVVDGTLSIDRDAAELVSRWVQNRRTAYEVLALDESSLSGQAMLTDCLEQSIASGAIGPADWMLTDELLLRNFGTDIHDADHDVRAIIKRFALGDYYQPVLIGRYFGEGGFKLDLRQPDVRRQMVADLKHALGRPCSVYVLYDRGTFEKSVTLMVDREITTFSHQSQSTIVGVFTPSRAAATRRQRFAAREVLETYGLRWSDVFTSVRHGDDQGDQLELAL